MKIFKEQLARVVADTALAKEAGLSAASIESLFAMPPKAELGDLSLPAFPFAKALKAPPPEAAKKLQAALNERNLSYCSEIRVVGPYVNFFITPQALAETILDDVEKRAPGDNPEQWHYGENESGHGKTMVIDISSPNIAKPLAVHHLRSTMIGNSVKKIYEANGWRVVGVNHLGDWGTGFGKMIAGFCREYPEIAEKISDKGLSDAEMESLFDGMSAQDLNQVYVNFSAAAKEDSDLDGLGKEEFRILEASLDADLDADTPEAIHMRRNFRLWTYIKRASLREFEVVYDLLGVNFVPYPIVYPKAKERFEKDPDAFYAEHCLYTGESYFVAGAPYCKEVVEEAKAKGIAEKSDDALVIFIDGRDKAPMMLLKDDGATSYHTRDLSAAKYRRDHFNMDKGLYVVDARQGLHFRHLFRGLEMLGYEWGAECEHVEFGIMLGKDEASGKWGIFSTRKGKLLLLHDLLSEAIEAVKAIVAEKNPELAGNTEELEDIATNIGVGAVVFNDLKQGRRNDVKFDWDEVLNFSGETGPYMLYQYVRLGSVQRKYVERYGTPGNANYVLLEHPQERELLKSIASFPEVIARACKESEPSIISRYLLDLSALFSSYWTATKDTGIVGDNQELSQARIQLVGALRKVLGKGLLLLGLRLVSKM